MKECKDCLTEYADDLFRVKARYKDKVYHSKSCLACERKYSRAYAAKNPEKIKENNAGLWAKLSEEQKQRYNAQHLEYCKNNRGLMNKARAKRRAIEKQALASWRNNRAIASFYDHAALMTLVKGEPYHVDHIDPLQSDLVCGLHCEANLRVIKGSENLSKKNKFTPYSITF